MNGALNSTGVFAAGSWATASVWAALLVASFAASWIPVAVFWLTGRPESIRRARNSLLARTLELLLFRHDGRTLLTACTRIARANALYLLQFAWPFLVSAIPILLLIVEGAAWFQHRPYRSGESAVVEIRLDPDHPVLETPAEFTTATGVADVVGPVRIPSRNELCYRLRFTGTEDATLILRIGTTEYRQTVAVGERLQRLSPMIVQPGLPGQFLEPLARLLPAGGPVTRWVTHYPQRTVFLGTWEVNAALVGLLMMVLFSLIVGKLCGVGMV